jgi:hypothetical protein
MPFQNWLPRTAYAWYENFPRSQTEKSSGQCLSLICDESLTCQNLNLNPGHFCSFTFILVSYGESHLLISWCADSKCGMMCSDEYRGRSRRHGVENRDSRIGRVLSGWTIERSGSAIYGLHRARGVWL